MTRTKRARRIVAVAAIALASAAACRSRSEPTPPLPSTLPAALANATASRAPQPAPEEVHFSSGPYRLRGDLFKPEGAGPFPAIVYNHGSEQNPSLIFFGDIGRWFQARGFVVLFPFRRGSTGSEGPYWEQLVDAQPEADRDRATVEQLVAQNDDVLAAIAFLEAQPSVARGSIAVAGCSFGGIETVLTAERSTGIYAAVDFAGASFTWARSPPMRERLIASVRKARVPIFFLQAENDFDTTPSRELARELIAVGGQGGAKIFPPHGTTTQQGHAHFCNHGMDEWGDDVLAFLRDAAARKK